MTLLAVADALAMMRESAIPSDEIEDVSLHDAVDRVLAENLQAPRDQPPFSASAMDGYAVRCADLPGRLRLIGEAAAGRSFHGHVETRECVRIFTGAVVPKGADAILIQENADVDGTGIVATEPLARGTFIRPKALDYAKDEVLLSSGRCLDAAAVTLAASTGRATMKVRRRPRVAVVMTGDELVPPGEPLSAGQIYASNNLGVAAIARDGGAEVVDCGIAADDLGSLTMMLAGIDADVIVTLGGASVGDHDLVRPALRDLGVVVHFTKLAMRPGKPVLFGTKGRKLYLGLPGNPVSSLVCAEVLLRPLIRKLLGMPGDRPVRTARLGTDLPANGDREHYMRARSSADGIVPFENQDSSLLATLARADVLLIRRAGEGARRAGENVEILDL